VNFSNLETPRLRLSKLKSNHVDNLYSIYKDKESMKYWDQFPHVNTTQTEKLLELLIDRIKNATGIKE
jgi:ribosomal-protein-alanine N-acetyltransferase